MSDPSALVRLFNELVWVLRREGFRISTAQAIDVVRAVEAVGLERISDVREAVAALVLRRAGDRPRFDEAFDGFFNADHAERRKSLWQRLREQGFTDDEITSVTALMAPAVVGAVDTEQPPSLKTLLGRGAGLDRLLAMADSARSIDAHSRLLVGFRTHRLLAQLGAGHARQTLAGMRRLLRERSGERGVALADALTLEFSRFEQDVRSHVRSSYEAQARDLERVRREKRLETRPLAGLSGADADHVRRRVRRLAGALGGASRRHSRFKLRGGIDPHRTLRMALRTGGIPFRLVHKPRTLKPTNLIVLCDVSDSVRTAASLLLEFAYATQKLFSRARSFVFVSELTETTELFASQPVDAAIARAWNDLVSQGENSNYGRVLREFDARYGRCIDRRTTIVVLGDGRTNYHPAHADVLDRLRRQSRALIWLCPEPRGSWGQGDSAMASYAAACTEAYEVGCAADLERVARLLVRSR